MESARRRADRFGRCDPARRVEPLDDVRQSRRRGLEAHAAGHEDDQAPGSAAVESRRQADEAAGHDAEARWESDLRDRHEASRHAERRNHAVSGIRRQARQVRRSEDREDAGGEACGQSRRPHRRCRRGHVVAREDCIGCVADRVGRRRRRKGFHRNDPRASEGRPHVERCVRGHQRRRRDQGVCGRCEENRSRIQHAVPVPRLHGANDRNGALHAPRKRRSGSRRRMPKHHSRRFRRRPVCRSRNAKRIRRRSAAASAGAAARRITCVRRR